MSIIEDMVRNVLETRFESLDEEIVDQAKNRIIDVVGCLIGGANAPGCLAIVNLVREWGGSKESTILVHGGKAPAHNVAMVNTIMARSYDFEPVEPYVEDIGIPGHISGTTIPTAFAVAEQKAVGGKELITSLILGDDLTSRIISASRFSIDLGWDNAGTANMFGATAIAGRLYKLDECKMLNALGIVLNQMAGSFQNLYDGTHCFKLPQGLAARAGIFSAELASKGFTGVEDPLLSKHGYFALYCRVPFIEILTKDLGRKFYADSVFKPYPACRLTHAAIDCVLQLIDAHDIKPEDMSIVTINVTPVVYNSFLCQPFKIGNVPQVSAAFNLRYTVADALLRKSVRLEHFTEEFIRDPKAVDLAQKVKLTGNMSQEKLFATEVEVKMRDGRKFSARVDVPKGDTISNPLTKQEIIEKFRSNVSFSGVLAKENVEKALDMIKRLEEIDDIGEITSLLVKV
jgi:2-methylcitrate dehydratase PrpD